MPKPIAVLISDVHYSLSTLELADKAMRMAIAKANKLNVPLIVAGDLHDTKANMRGECVNAMIKTFRLIKGQSFVLIGNHDRINEKSEQHSLNFLQPFTMIVGSPLGTFQQNRMIEMIPYSHDQDIIKAHLKKCDKNEILIMHQGIQGSDMGEYVQDKSAITKDDVAGFRVISGHYHTRQSIDLPNGGVWDYIGNPYTVSFGEANDPEKGFQILMEDGTLEFVPTNLRKHLIIQHDLGTKESIWSSTPAYSGSGRDDLMWVKINGTKEQILEFKRNEWLKEYGISQSVRLDLIPTDTTTSTPVKALEKAELLDSLIDSLSNTTDERKERLKLKWKDLCE